jgi:putative autoinducer-2 (AI-2) aldolase
VAAELGAHIVKTYYCDNFGSVVTGCPVPVVIAGGKKSTEMDALNLAYNAIRDGAVGVDMGRNIWQSEFPVPMAKAVRVIVHDNYSADEAYKVFRDEKASTEIKA